MAGQLAQEIAEALGSVKITTRSDTDSIRVPVQGIGTGAAYAAGDQFGGLCYLPNVAAVPGGTFVITNVTFYDYDNEGIGKVMHLFRRQPGLLAGDNAALSESDIDISNALPGSPLQIAVFTSYSNNQVGTLATAFYGKCAPNSTGIWFVLSTLGADNIAAAAIPEIEFVLVRD